jgi:hypothetical protein
LKQNLPHFFAKGNAPFIHAHSEEIGLILSTLAALWFLASAGTTPSRYLQRFEKKESYLSSPEHLFPTELHILKGSDDMYGSESLTDVVVNCCGPSQRGESGKVFERADGPSMFVTRQRQP